MKNASILLPWTLLLELSVVLAACSPGNAVVAPAPSSAPATQVSTAETFADPFAYCAAVGTVDKPDARYAGPQIPDQIINGFKRAAGLEASSEPMDILRKTTIWRCMDKKVYACNFGANLPCDSKANTDRTPSQGTQDYCKADPSSDVIPMSVTGHDTIYSWRCAKGSPQVFEQIEQVDTAGYLAQIWYPIQPGP